MTGQTRSSEAYMARDGEEFRHAMSRPSLTAMYGDGLPIHHVRIEEDADGGYWAWWDNEDARFKWVWRSRSLVEIAFPYGSKVEEERGRGKMCQVKVVDLGVWKDE